MKEGIAANAIYRSDYTVYPWTVKYLDLHFDVGLETTVVRAEMEFENSQASGQSQDIVLNGSDLDLLSVSVNSGSNEH